MTKRAPFKALVLLIPSLLPLASGAAERPIVLPIRLAFRFSRRSRADRHHCRQWGSGLRPPPPVAREGGPYRPRNT
jgi:hypothetical protein